VDENPGAFRPPYLPFKTFWTFVNDLLAAPLPPQIDRSLMTSKSGTDQVHLTAALKAFGLIDGGQTVTGLRALEATDEQARAAWLGDQIRAYYPIQVGISLQNGTEQQLKDSFRDTFKITAADTLRKSITFFLHAAQQGGIPLSPHFPTTRSGSGAPGTPRPRRSASRRKPLTDPAKVNGAAKPTQPDGDTYTVDLESGARATLTVTMNVMTTSVQDRKFLFELIDKLQSYGTSARKGSNERPGAGQNDRRQQKAPTDETVDAGGSP
jgi:hypothetical protein